MFCCTSNITPVVLSLANASRREVAATFAKCRLTAPTSTLLDTSFITRCFNTLPPPRDTTITKRNGCPSGTHFDFALAFADPHARIGYALATIYIFTRTASAVYDPDIGNEH
jgi:hypothetical protein